MTGSFKLIRTNFKVYVLAPYTKQCWAEYLILTQYQIYLGSEKTPNTEYWIYLGFENGPNMNTE